MTGTFLVAYGALGVGVVIGYVVAVAGSSEQRGELAAQLAQVRAYHARATGLLDRAERLLAAVRQSSPFST